MNHLQKQKTIQKFTETEDSRYIYQNEQDKACFSHGMAFGDFRDWNRKRTFDKILRDAAFNIAKICKYDGYQMSFDSMAFLIKKTLVVLLKIKIWQARFLWI